MKQAPRITIPTDIINDERIITAEALMPEFSEIIAGIIFKLLCFTAANEGYFLPWDSDRTRAVTIRKAGIRTEFSKVCQIVDELVDQDFFNKEVYEEYGVLVSDILQEAYLKAVARRRKVEIFTKYIVVNIPDSLLNDGHHAQPARYEEPALPAPQPAVQPVVQQMAQPEPQAECSSEPVSQAVFVPTPIPKPVSPQEQEVFFQQIYDRKVNLEYLAKAVKISNEELLELVPIFKEHCLANDAMHNSSNACYSHFANWVRVHVATERKKQSTAQAVSTNPIINNANGFTQTANSTASYSRAAERKHEEAMHEAEFQGLISRLMADNRP